MKELIYAELHNAIKDQDWVAVARAALKMEQLVMETDIINMQEYFNAEDKFKQECSDRSFGKIIDTKKTRNKVRG